MLHRSGDFEEWELAAKARNYISLYAKPGDSVVYIPYRDVPSGKKKYVKFVKVDGVEEWVYVDNSQGS